MSIVNHDARSWLPPNFSKPDVDAWFGAAANLSGGAFCNCLGMCSPLFTRGSILKRMRPFQPLSRSIGRQYEATFQLTPKQQVRSLSLTTVSRDALTKAPSTPATATLSPRWLSDTKQRIGKCVLFGLQPHQTEQAGSILKEIARDWRELLAGSEGFLTGSDRRGLYRQAVVWGEMDSMVSSLRPC